ncbi:MAG: DUF134 domain-containing protein [Bacteriovoracaceae bacterium]|nr:DUF134 domain-containing protein [Bacteriovoracaceae bacterium]
MAPWRKKRRFIEREYNNHVFKPKSIPMSQLASISIGHDEMEAVRLVDLDHMRQADAAEKMGVSSATIQRIIESTREKIVKALVEGHAIVIDGGDYKIKKDE